MSLIPCVPTLQREFISNDFGATLTLLEDCNGSVSVTLQTYQQAAGVSNVDTQEDKWDGCAGS